MMTWNFRGRRRRRRRSNFQENLPQIIAHSPRRLVRVKDTKVNVIETTLHKTLPNVRCDCQMGKTSQMGKASKQSCNKINPKWIFVFHYFFLVFVKNSTSPNLKNSLSNIKEQNGMEVEKDNSSTFHKQ